MPLAIHQEVTFDADRGRVYKALTHAGEFSEFTGAEAASLDPVPGAPISLFGGHITGCNVELVPDRRLVQAWRAASWDDGRYSIVSFQLDDDGSAATKLVCDHVGFPDAAHDELAGGWEKMYWAPLKRYLG